MKSIDSFLLFILESFSQCANAYSPILSSLSEAVTETRFLFWQKAKSGITVIESGSVTVWRFIQSSKAPSPITETFSGISTSVIESQLLNKLFGISFNPEGSDIDLRQSKLLKVPSSISVMVPGSITFSAESINGITSGRVSFCIPSLNLTVFTPVFQNASYDIVSIPAGIVI